MTAKKPPPAALTIQASRRRCEELLDEIASKKTFISEAFVDIGVALVEIETKELYKALGHTTFGELLTERGVFGPSQAYKLMAIARSLPRRAGAGDRQLPTLPRKRVNPLRSRNGIEDRDGPLVPPLVAQNGVHFTMVTLVPRPGADSIENSSTRRRLPDRPKPIDPAVR